MIDLRDFISFLKKPSFEKQFEIRSIGSFLKLVGLSFLTLLAIGLVISLIISTPLRYFNLLPQQKEINFSSLNILKISLLVPLIEELLFRLPLRISKINIATFLIIVLFLILNKFNIYVALCFSIVLFGFLFLLIKQGSNSLNWGKNYFTKYFPGLFYFQALLFGFLHLTNYNLDFKYFYLFPFFIIFYIFIGCFFGYIRVRYAFGIYVCIATHILLNSIYCFIYSP